MHVGSSLCLLLVWMSAFLICVALPLEDPQSLSTHQSSHRSTPSNVDDIPPLRQNPSRRTFPRLGSQPPNHPRDRYDGQHNPIPPIIPRGAGGFQQLPSHPNPNKAIYAITTRAFITFGLLTPVTAAAQWMTYFFELIAQRIELGYWAHEPPSNHVRIEAWAFELEFFCNNAIVPWEFVQDYVIDKLEDVAKGFTGVYHEHLMGTINGVVDAWVTVRFRLLR